MLTLWLITSGKGEQMDTLISDGSLYEISKKVTDMLRSLLIADYQPEPHHQHQIKSELHGGTVGTGQMSS